MKINCEVLGVETNGDELAIRAQGCVKGAANWRPLGSIRIEVPCIEKNQRAFYVGRKFTLSVDLK